MAVICALRFDDYSGAIAGDEAYWFLRRRDSFFTEFLHQVLDEGASEKLGMTVAYGGTGNPSFQYEIARRTKQKTKELLAKLPLPEGQRPNLNDVEEIGRILLGELHAVVHRRVDAALKLLYGFDTSDYTRGFFEANGARYDITQDSVKKLAKSWINSNDCAGGAKPIYENFGILIGYDKRFGFRGFHINGEKGVLATMSGGFDAIGPGKYASALEFAKFLNNKTLDQRRNGLDRIEGLAGLIAATQRAGEYYHEAGGNISVTIIDGRKPTHAERYREIHDDRARLAGELVTAWNWGQISKMVCYDLLDGLMFHAADIDGVEEQLFRRATDARKLEKILRGYKIDWTAPEPAAAAAGRENDVRGLEV